jgi:PPOX class probable F420-dependent enzyme
VDLDEARAFIREHHAAVLASRNKSGGIQMTPVAAGIDDEGRLVVSSREHAFKVRNLRRDPYVSLLILSDGISGRWIQVQGSAEVVSLPDALQPLIDYYRGISGEHPDWDEYRRAMAEQERVIVRITLDRAGPDQHDWHD